MDRIQCTPLPALQRAALHLLGDLAAYDREFQLLLENWFDAEQLQIVSSQLETVRRACSGFEQLAAPWAGLLTTHCELLHATWLHAAAATDDSAAAARALRTRHKECVASVGAALVQSGLRIGGNAPPPERHP